MWSCPGPATALALAAVSMVVPLLILLAHGPLRVDCDRHRFLAAAGIPVIVWCVSAIIIAVRGNEAIWPDAVAGALVLATAILAFGMLWSLLCWGFTASLLAAICKVGAASSREAWFRAYGGGCSVESFAEDRLSVLLGANLVEVEGEMVRCKGRAGRGLAWAVRLLRRLNGLPEHG